MDVEIRRLGPGEEDAVAAAAGRFDGPPRPEATPRFLAEPTHHLLLAYDAAGAPVGFISGVETTHPDKGTEMFLYELSVDEPVRRRGIGTALVRALGALAAERGCYADVGGRGARQRGRAAHLRARGRRAGGAARVAGLGLRRLAARLVLGELQAALPDTLDVAALDVDGPGRQLGGLRLAGRLGHGVDDLPVAELAGLGHRQELEPSRASSSPAR